MPKALDNLRIVAEGKLKDRDKFPGWIRYHGGDYSKKVDSRITHLIASEEAFRNNVDAVKAAKDLGTVKIVQADWLYDSLQTKPPRPKPTVSYLWDNVLQPELRPRKRPRRSTPPSASKPKGRMKDPFAKKTPAKRSKTTALPKENVFVNESINERWEATLYRTHSGGKRENFRLAIFESTQKPPTYSAYVKYSRVGKSDVSVLTPPKSTLALAQTNFKEFFVLQTGIEWDDRRNSTLPLPKKDNDGNALPIHEGWYTYQGESILSAFLKHPTQPQPTVMAEGAATLTAELRDTGKQVDTKDSIDVKVVYTERNTPPAKPTSIEDNSAFEGDIDSSDINLSQSLLESTLCAPGDKIDTIEITNPQEGLELLSRDAGVDYHEYSTEMED